MKTTSFTQAAIFVYFTGAHVSGIWVLGKWLTNQTKVSFVAVVRVKVNLVPRVFSLFEMAGGSGEDPGT